MELWIRSQESEKIRPLLLKVNEIEIGDYDDDMNCIVVNNLHCVGIYETKERALEVLDEIQKYLTPTIQMLDETIGNKGVCQIGTIMTIVFEMPKE